MKTWSSGVADALAGWAGLEAVWAWTLAQADIAPNNTATSRGCLCVYFIVWGVVWLLEKTPRFAHAGTAGQVKGVIGVYYGVNNH
jgi:hypothetical protein